MEPSGLDGKPPRLIRQENESAIKDSAILCKFSRYFIGADRLATLLRTDTDTLQAIGDRIVSLERHFNNQRGFDRSDDTLPYANEIAGFEAALTEYYSIRGWNNDGTVPGNHIASHPFHRAQGD